MSHLAVWVYVVMGLWTLSLIVLAYALFYIYRLSRQLDLTRINVFAKLQVRLIPSLLPAISAFLLITAGIFFLSNPRDYLAQYGGGRSLHADVFSVIAIGLMLATAFFCLNSYHRLYENLRHYNFAWNFVSDLQFAHMLQLPFLAVSCFLQIVTFSLVLYL